MRQRPQYLLAAFAASGHPVYLVDPMEPEPRSVGGVHLVPSLAGVPSGQVILYVHFAPVRTSFDRFRDPAVIYDLLDDLSIYDADERGLPEQRRVRAHHPAVMAVADVVIASSPVLVDRHRHERADIVLVENGVDVARFALPTSPPSDLPSSGLPVVGYHGAIASWFDFDLFDGVARRRPDWRFLLVGPVLPEARERADEVAALPNVLLLGERPSDAMPGYVQSFDVGVVWFVVDHLTEAVSPLKLYEYLAAGVPAVSTPLPSCVATPGVRIAADVEEMVTAIAAALDDPVVADGVAAAASWENRLAPVLHRLDDAGLRRVLR